MAITASTSFVVPFIFDLEFEPNKDYYDELEFKFEDEETELEFSYEPGISLASLATCACPCLRHHETGYCLQIKFAVLKHASSHLTEII